MGVELTTSTLRLATQCAKLPLCKASNVSVSITTPHWFNILLDVSGCFTVYLLYLSSSNIYCLTFTMIDYPAILWLLWYQLIPRWLVKNRECFTTEYVSPAITHTIRNTGASLNRHLLAPFLKVDFRSQYKQIYTHMYAIAIAVCPCEI